MTDRIICIFGDSIAWGAVDPKKGGWVGRLKSYLEIKDKYNAAVYNLGVSGDNTDDLLNRFSMEAKAREPNSIIFSIGINDAQYIRNEANPRVNIKRFENNIIKLMKLARKFTKTILFIGLTPVDEAKTMPIPWNRIKYYKLSRVKDYNQILKSICKKNKVQFIDIFDQWLNIKYKDLLYDGLHPNHKGHKILFETVKKSLINNKLI